MTSGSPDSLDLRGRTVLLIDDEPANLAVLSAYLENAGLHVLVARDGESGLDQAQYARPDLILLDVQLPGIDGFETCRRLRVNLSTAVIPVLFMSVRADTTDRLEGFVAGGLDYITKPFQQQEVLARVTTHLRLRQLALSLQEQNLQLQAAQAALHQANEDLERRVRERTAALVKANQELHEQIVKRQQAEEELKQYHNHLEELVRSRTAELEVARERAEEANRAKSAFLANVSHELRTPLNAILGYTQILRRGDGLAPLQENGLAVIQQSGEHLLSLINDVLDLTKIEAGKLDLASTDVHFPTFLQGIGGLGRLRAARKGLTFAYEAAPDLPAGIWVDAKRLRQVLLNLLGNAIKFTARGGVTLRVSTVSGPPPVAADPALSDGHGPPTMGTIRFEVIDTGVGISPEDLLRLFRPFEQVGDVQQRAQGTGLGLAISQRLLQQMGSALRVSSRLEEGSRFWFDLLVPLVTAPATGRYSDRPVIGYEGPRRTLLVADDSVENRGGLVNLLAPLDFTVIEAADGLVAVEQAQAHRPDAILMDMRMPRMSGAEAARAIRQLAALRDVVIIATSASVFEDDRQQSALVGCNAFLPKPIHVESLLDLLATHLGLTWQRVGRELTTLGREAADDEAALTPPSPEDLAVLFELASIGDVFGLQQHVARFAQGDPAFGPFARKLGRLADLFELEQARALISRYRQPDP